jgi:hypothetical protein
VRANGVRDLDAACIEIQLPGGSLPPLERIFDRKLTDAKVSQMYIDMGDSASERLCNSR